MFGYINVNGKELSDESKATYQAYYCGLCQSLRSDCGMRGQALLNYDMTFLVVLLTGLYEPEDTSKQFTCVIHPVKKHLARNNEITEYAAHMNVILAYHNLIDDWQDDKNLAKKTMAGIIEEDYKRIAKQYPRQVQVIENWMARQAEYEASGEQNIDLVAGLTGEVIGELFAWKEDEWYEELKNLGFYIGKFIYLMDAYDDLEGDIRKQRYNPLIHLKEENPDNFEVLCRLMMTSMMSEAAKAFERLPILTHADILRNIIYSGVWSRYEYIQKKRNKRNKK